MKYQVKVPSAGESVTEAYIGKWKKKSGDVVKKGDVIVDLESQKATFELEAEVGGRLEILRPTSGDKVGIGEVIATIEEGDTSSLRGAQAGDEAIPPEILRSAQDDLRSDRHAPSGLAMTGPMAQTGPAARRAALASTPSTPRPASAATGETPKPAIIQYTLDTARGERSEPASRIRKHIAANLVSAQHTAAILTTFNELDMTEVIKLRKQYKDSANKKHGVNIGMVGLFALATARALKTYPLINATFTGEEIIYRDFVDLSIAVATERGLVVPVLRDVDKMDWITFEKTLAAVADRARQGKLSIPEMTGGTFTITNGGVFGSLLATPLLNMPQSAILGIHKIEERPVVREGQIVIRPMMYVALSYDHRLIDGKEAIEFLVKVKEAIEKPSLIVNEKELT